MRWKVFHQVDYNSFDYFDKVLITENGFREYDVRWLLGKEINPNGFFVLGCAYGTFIQERLDEKRVVVGHDFRSYSQDLSRSLILGLLSTGAHVIDIGLALTPMVYFAQHHFKTRAGVIVTASHNENGWTGLKLADGLSSTFGPDSINQFKQVVMEGRFLHGCGTFEAPDDLFNAYQQHLLSFGKLSKPVKVVIAAGNGTAGRFAPTVLRNLGCEVVELHTEPDWNFPHFNPNPESLDFLKSISNATLEANAEIGIGIDGDGDRIGVVDNLGREVFADKLGLLLARWLCPKYPNRNIVIDVKSTGLFFDDPLLQKTNTNVVMWKTGHSYMKAKVSELDAIAGFEKSGHWFFNSPLGLGYDDSMVSAIHLLQMLSDWGLPLSDLVDSLPQTWQSPTLGAYCPDNVKYAVLELVVEQYRQDQILGNTIGGLQIKNLNTINGVRFVLEDDSWGLVRVSSNKPSLVLVAESRSSKEQLYEIIRHIQARLAETKQVGEYDQEMPPLN